MSEVESLKILESVLKERYASELDRREKINASLNLPVAILLALFGVASFLDTALRGHGDLSTLWKEHSCSLPFFFGFYGLFVLLLLGTSYHVYDAYHDPQPYEYLPRSREVKEYYEATLVRACTDQADKVDWAQVELYFCRFMVDRYAEAADTNQKRNERKSNCVFEARLCLAATLASLVCAGAIRVVFLR